MAEIAKPNPNLPVAVAKETKQSLVIIGSVLLVLFFALLIFNRAVGSETKEKSQPTTQPSGNQATSGTGTGAASETEKTTEKKDVPSDTLLTAILASAAALILAGVLYGRISTIKLPGGVEIDLNKAEKETIAQQVAEQMPDADRETVATVTQQAATEVRHLKASGGAVAPPEKIGEIVASLAPPR